MRPWKELERKLRELTEGAIGGRFKGPVHPLEVARVMARLMQAGRQDSLTGPVLPNVFAVHLHPGEEAPLVSLGDRLHQELHRYLSEEARSRDGTWAGPLRFVWVADDAIPPGRVVVEARVEGIAPAPPAHEFGTLAAPSLEVVDGFGLGKVFAVPTPRCVLGRDAAVDVRIGDPAVSHRHAAITWSAGRFTLEDLGSRRGTLLNGEPVTAATRLQAGDELTLGHTRLRFIAAVQFVPQE